MIHKGTPQMDRWLIRENPMKMDDLGVPPMDGKPPNGGKRWLEPYEMPIFWAWNEPTSIYRWFDVETWDLTDQSDETELIRRVEVKRETW